MRISDWSSDVCSSDLEQHDSTCYRQCKAKDQAGGKPPIQNPGQPHSHEGRCRNLHQRSRDRDVSHRQQVTQREMQTNTEHEEDDPDLGKLIGETGIRSEEHTSELQSLMRNSYAVFCWKKKKTQN